MQTPSSSPAEAAPDFFLTAAGEYRPLSLPRACRIVGWLEDSSDAELVRVEIEPPLIGQALGLGSRDLRELLLSARFDRESLRHLTRWPCPVGVFRAIDQLDERETRVDLNRLEAITRAEIYPSYQDALRAAKEVERRGLE